MKDEISRADPARPSLRERNKQLARDVVLDAAERLLRKGELGEFSMRALAAEAQVGFATPFNHFGSKNAIMQALSARLVGRMLDRFNESVPPGDAFDRVLAMGAISAALLLDQPEVYRAVVASVGAVQPIPSAVRTNSESLWSRALGHGEGIAPELRDFAQTRLPEQIAYLFRGCLSFWIASELTDEALYGAFAEGVATLMLGLVEPTRRPALLQHLTQQTGQAPPDAAGSPP
jgi:AcrR family transcriptional regulator